MKRFIHFFYTSAASSRPAAPTRKSEPSADTAGSWASIASSNAQQKADTQLSSSGWDAPTTTSNDTAWSDSPAVATQNAAETQPASTTSTNDTPASKPSSWASLLK